MNPSMGGAEGLRDFISSLGYEPPQRIEPGKWERFSVKKADPRNRDGSARLFPDSEGGYVEDFSTGQTWTWQAKREKPRNEAEQRAWREKVERSRREAEAQRQQDLKETSERARGHWKSSAPADELHPYLKAKGVKSHGARLYRGPMMLNGMRCDGGLVIPAWNADGEIKTLQIISPEGEKRFLNGPKPPGAYYSVGKPDGVVCIAEGFATAASIYEATGHATAIAFDRGNLEATAKAIRAKLPDARIILCADNDIKDTGSNPGVEDATKAARTVGGLLAIPEMGGAKCDFNDLARAKGADAVKAVIEAAGQPQASAPVSQAQPAPENRPDAVVVDWPEPKPLPEGLPAVLPFDYELLPDALRPWIRDICERMQCPPDYPAVTAITALGSVIGRKVGIRPQESTDWGEVPNQWALVVGRPGVLKSPAMEAALAPLNALIAAALEKHTEERAAWETSAKLAKMRADAGEKAAQKKLAANPMADVRAELSAGEIGEEPTLKRYRANDTSGASLGELLRQNQNGLLVYRDELVSLLKGLDREESAGERGFYLTGWGGHSAYTFDRIGRGMNLSIPAVCLSLLGSTQPGKIAEYLRAATNGGAGDDGLIQRFGMLVWPDPPKQWRDVDTWPDNEAKRKAVEVFKRMDALTPETVGAQQDKGFNGEPEGVPYLRFDKGALEVFRAWRSALETRLRSGELHHAMESHLAKYRKLVPSLALICHLADNGTGPVTETAIVRALAWAEYLESHAMRAYDSVTSPEKSAAKAILEKLRKREIPRPGEETFKARDIYIRGWGNLTDRQLVIDGLQLLAEFDWIGIRHLSAAETGGRPATEYHVNPKALEA